MRRFAVLLAVLLAGLASAPLSAAEDPGPKKAGDLAGQCVLREAARLTGGTQADAGTVAAQVCRICRSDFAAFADAFAREESRAGRAVDRPALDASVVQLCLKRAATFAEKGIATRQALEKSYGANPAAAAKPAAPAGPGPAQSAPETKTAPAKPAEVSKQGAKAKPEAKAHEKAGTKAAVKSPAKAAFAAKSKAAPSAKPARTSKPATSTTPAGGGSKAVPPGKSKPKSAPAKPRPSGQT